MPNLFNTVSTWCAGCVPVCVAELALGAVVLDVEAVDDVPERLVSGAVLVLLGVSFSSADESGNLGRKYRVGPQD